MWSIGIKKSSQYNYFLSYLFYTNSLNLCLNKHIQQHLDKKDKNEKKNKKIKKYFL